MAKITIGLKEVQVGVASSEGVMPDEMSKIGKVYKDTCTMTQESSEVTEHYEEGHAAPEVRTKTHQIPVLEFSLMDCDVQDLIGYLGGENVGTEEEPKWGYDGSELVANRAIRLLSDQGLCFDIPNADIDAVINSDFSSSGIFLVEFTVTPMAVSEGKAICAY